MAQPIRVGIIGGGWPGGAHARGYTDAGGFKIAAIADLIPERRKTLVAAFNIDREYAQAKDIIADSQIDAVSICLPTHLHLDTAIEALRAGKHVICEQPPALDAKEAKQIDAVARKKKKILLYGFQRRFGGPEQAARQAIAKGYAGDIYHARVQWMRTRGVPIGTGWFTTKAQSGGGAMLDIGVHMLDLAWHLLGEPKPSAAFAATYRKFDQLLEKPRKMDVEDSGFAMIRFEGGKSIELAASWALNQPPQQQGTLCRLFGDKGAIDVYTPQGATLYRNFDDRGQAKTSPLKPPNTTGHAALMRHFRDCIVKKTKPMVGGPEGTMLMRMMDAIYRSAESSKSVEVKE